MYKDNVTLSEPSTTPTPTPTTTTQMSVYNATDDQSPDDNSKGNDIETDVYDFNEDCSFQDYEIMKV